MCLDYGQSYVNIWSRKSFFLNNNNEMTSKHVSLDYGQSCVSIWYRKSFFWNNLPKLGRTKITPAVCNCQSSIVL